MSLAKVEYFDKNKNVVLLTFTHHFVVRHVVKISSLLERDHLTQVLFEVSPEGLRERPHPVRILT
jgi:hypothetical protein